MIPRSKIDEIMNAAHVEDVVGEYISLKKRGANLLGLCPFHQEKTPSFNVSPAKGIYKCFGCGKAGNAVNFIMEYEHLDYINALKHLAEKYNIEWPEQEISSEELLEERRKKTEKESLQIINNFAEKYFADILENDDEGKTIGLSYFEERGFRPETISKFHLGFSKDSWDHFTQTALESGFNQELLIKSGLVKQSEQGKVYDAYRNRVIFTIHGLNGKPIAFAGRILKSKDEKSPKYVNSPETELYHKSNELYGLYFARNAISKLDYVYLVEGYTDVISMHQAGVENVVASSGTSLTENQIKLIKRFTNNVCVLYDGDAAGIKASLRGIDMLLEAGLNVKVLLFPEGEDPDSYCRKVGSLEFGIFLEEHKQDFILFKTSLLREDAGNDPVKRADLIRNIVESIAKVPDAFKRSNFIKECSNLLKVDEQLLINETNKLFRKNQSVQAKTPIEKPEEEPLNYEDEIKALLDTQSSFIQECDVIRVIIRFGNYDFEGGYKNVAHFILSEISKEDIEIENRIAHEIFNELNEELKEDKIDTNRLIHHINPQISTFLADLTSMDTACFEDNLSPNWEKKYDIMIDKPEEKYSKDVIAAIDRLKLKHLDKLILQNQQGFNAVQTDEEIETLQKVHIHLLQLRTEIAEKYHTVVIK